MATTLGYIASSTDDLGSTVLGQLRPNLWYLEYLTKEFVTAYTGISWSVALSGQGVDIYLIDSGVVPTHSSFGVRVTELWAPVGGDVTGSGTAAAGLLISEQYGVARRAELWSCQALDADGNFDSANFHLLVNAIISNINSRQRPSVIVCNVLQTPTVEDVNVEVEGPTSILEVQLQRLLDLSLPVVVPAGDGFYQVEPYELLGPMVADVVTPSRMEDVITVGSIDWDNTASFFSNYGDLVNVWAPGEGVSVITPTGGVEGRDSTMCSAALVGGVVALYFQKNPYGTGDTFKRFIREHGRHDELVNYPDGHLADDALADIDEVTEGLPYYAILRTDDNPFEYVVFASTYNNVRLHAFYTKANLEFNTTTLGSVNTLEPFNIQLNVTSTTPLGELKKIRYTTVSKSHDWITIGENSGKVFGYPPPGTGGEVISITVRVSDGMYQLTKTVTGTVVESAAKVSNIGGSTKRTRSNVVEYHLTSTIGDNVSNFLLVNPIPIAGDLVEPISRQVFLFDRVSGVFNGSFVSEAETGRFVFATHSGLKQVIVLDPDLEDPDEKPIVYDRIWVA